MVEAKLLLELSRGKRGGQTEDGPKKIISLRKRKAGNKPKASKP